MASMGESLTKLPDVLKERPPVWRQQWITMLASVAAWKSGRSKICLELVSQLDRPRAATGRDSVVADRLAEPSTGNRRVGRRVRALK